MSCPFRDVNRKGDAHFCARSCPAPYSESHTNILRPLTHTAKTPMGIALFLNGFGIDSAAVVTNGHAQEVALVLNFNLDRCRLGMPQRVHDRFPADEKELLLNDRAQWPRFSLDEGSKPGTPPGGEFA